ncbi:cytochrome [Pseudoalteromonas citrea]|uniref:Cytochrome n=1 Tax=Pseudoalteromonas citrea TaxID=43655 RepID=A0A5S3XK89_9GAMM|nr:cytochrome b/b6 domain-containing protein [Pseudoalteromonas citrea]TMP43762.1 cytochrome [Pseudoalteromonas citrea]TMP55313.1 cytochrome [Pseudoalteromonas citrea]
MVKVWDGFIRGFHWLLVIGIAVLYISGDEGWLDLHFVTGYMLLALMITRIVWGVFGSSTARLSSLFHSPKAVISALLKDQPATGHNPAGSVMILVFFTLIFIQLLSGLMSSDDILVEGPLVQYVSYAWVELANDLHRDNIDLLLLAIGLHISAIAFYRIKGKKLVKTLVTGYSSDAADKPHMRSGKFAYMLFIVLATALLFLWGQEPLMALLNVG